MNKVVKNAIYISVIVTLTLSAGYFIFIKNNPNEDDSLKYTNNGYGFSFALLETWRGYTVSVDKWTGNKIDDQGEASAAEGSVISIHNPK